MWKRIFKNKLTLGALVGDIQKKTDLNSGFHILKHIALNFGQKSFTVVFRTCANHKLE